MRGEAYEREAYERGSIREGKHTTGSIQHIRTFPFHAFNVKVRKFVIHMPTWLQVAEALVLIFGFVGVLFDARGVDSLRACVFAKKAA